MTPLVQTLWYRAPELLMGAEHYTCAIDAFSAGCVMAEFVRGGRPLMPGAGELDQIAHQHRMLGTPNIKEWPELAKLPHYRNYQFKQHRDQLEQEFNTQTIEAQKRTNLNSRDCLDSSSPESARHSDLDSVSRVRDRAPLLSALGLDLLRGLLRYNPLRRLSAADAASHDWFNEYPLMQSRGLMPTFQSANEAEHEAKSDSKRHKRNMGEKDR